MLSIFRSSREDGVGRVVKYVRSVVELEGQETVPKYLGPYRPDHYKVSSFYFQGNRGAVQDFVRKIVKDIEMGKKMTNGCLVLLIHCFIFFELFYSFVICRELLKMHTSLFHSSAH